jgi:hypothetical protein
MNSDLTPAIDRGLTVAGELPTLVANERGTVTGALHEELSRMIAALREERMAAMEQVGKERSRAIADLNVVFSEQREETARRADQIAQARIDYAMGHIDRLVAVVMGSITLLTLLGVIVLVRVLLRRPTLT